MEEEFVGSSAENSRRSLPRGMIDISRLVGSIRFCSVARTSYL